MLRTEDVTRDFGGVHAVAGVTVEVRRGTLTGLIGPNGAGKSTLLAMLAGTIPVTSVGDLRGGRRHRRARLPPRPDGARRDVSAGQRVQAAHRDGEPAQRGPGQPGDSLAGALRGRRYWRADEEAAIARARALLDRFGLSAHADTYAGDLSGGQRRLTEISALMAKLAVLLLDEPMAGVHPRLARQIGAQLLGLCAEGMTILDGGARAGHHG